MGTEILNINIDASEEYILSKVSEENEEDHSIVINDTVFENSSSDEEDDICNIEEITENITEDHVESIKSIDSIEFRIDILENFIENQKNKPLFLTTFPWEPLKNEDDLNTFLSSSRHIDTFDREYKMTKNFILKCLNNYKLLNINIDDVNIIKKHFFGNQEEQAEKKILKPDNNQQPQETTNDITFCKTDNNTLDLNSNYKTSVLENSINNLHNIKENKYKQNLAKNTKKQIKEFLFNDKCVTLTDKKLKIIRFFKDYNVDIETDVFDILDNDNNKIISDSDISEWYEKIISLETRKNKIYNPSSLILIIFLWIVEFIATKLNITELKDLTKNIELNNLPVELENAKEYIDEVVFNKVPKYPILDIGYYIFGVYIKNKTGVNVLNIFK